MGTHLDKLTHPLSAQARLWNCFLLSPVWNTADNPYPSWFSPGCFQSSSLLTLVLDSISHLPVWLKNDTNPWLLLCLCYLLFKRQARSSQINTNWGSGGSHAALSSLRSLFLIFYGVLNRGRKKDRTKAPRSLQIERFVKKVTQYDQ